MTAGVVSAMSDLLGRRSGPESEATAVSASGLVAGTAAGRAFLWRDGRTVDLGPDRGGSNARGVNDDGVVVGCSWTLTDPPAATVWRSRGPVRLPGLPGAASRDASAINATGLVVGRCTDGDSGRIRAVAWTGSDVVELAGLGPGPAEALAVGDDGVIVGSATTAEGRTHACRWVDGRPEDLGTLGGDRSVARAVNAAGHVAGWSTTADGRTHAVLWTDGAPLDLGTLGGSRSRATGLSDTGQVVGWSTRADSHEPVAFSWRDGRMDDLGTLGGANSRAGAVNAAGWVVGRSSTGAGAMGLRLRRGGWSWENHAMLVRTAG